MTAREVVIPLKLRPWQRPLIDYFRARRNAGLDAHASVIAHRRAGKDRASLFIELEEMLASPREVWHALPEYAQARKVIWDALTDKGERLIDVAFPPAIRRRKNDTEMSVELVTGSLWRLVGADNFNSLMGANPRHVTFSEFALTRPQSREFVRPILAANGGTELTITTPRGYNHAFQRHELAKKQTDWYHGFHPVSQTHLVPQSVLDTERASMPAELYAQEWECSFSAANVGSILGSRVEAAEKEGRVSPEVTWQVDQPVILSSDIGFRDASAFWFWQARPGGFALIDYAEESGLDADDWIVKLRTYAYTYGEVWLPHDALAKTFATKRSALERFMAAGFKARLVPQVAKAHRVNAARMILPQCRVNSITCERGLEVLRNWSYKWDDIRRVFSQDPDHDEYSHGGDAFSYGAVVMKPQLAPEPEKRKLPQAAMQAFSLDQLHEARERDLYDR